ncbi:fungal-specific transcription factor domain-containing protein [Xylariales sp. AK1849]|nr:fungal-specific transcription factor domain-containing protein [Xylariales sp. AK1849]
MRRASNSSAQRLPVNQRRNKVPLERRKRVSTACNVRRIKCSGEQPCVQCGNTSRDCQYPAVVERISIPRTELDDLKAKCAWLEQCLEQAIPDEAHRRCLVAQVATGSISASSPMTATSEFDHIPDEESAPNEGRLLSDPDGTARYLGSTSGAMFLDLVKEFMMTIFQLAWPGSHHLETTFLGSFGRYQTYDSRPLVIHDVDPFWLPLKTEMTMMMAQLRYFIQDGSGDFTSGGIYYWGDLDASFFDLKPLETSADPQTLRRLALFHAAFAMTCQLETPSGNNNNTQRGETFFARARWLIGNPLDTATSTVYDIPVLAMMSTYLMEMNRRDAACVYVSLGMHIAVVHGIHRGWVPDEESKRSFWTLYILDRWFSVLMGRPPTILDEAIRLPFPNDLPGLPSAVGLRAHVELAKISGYIVCNTYRVAPWDHRMSMASARIDNALSWLASWLTKLPPELQITGDELSNDRACCELHMAYNQLLILTLRPILFVAVKKAVAERLINRTSQLDGHPQIEIISRCTEAARRNLRLGRWIRDLIPSRKLLSQGLHNMFNAAVILLLHQLLVDTLDDMDAMGIIFVIECFDSEGLGNSNYPRDCARVLRDMSTLVQRLRNRNLDDLSQVDSSPASMGSSIPAFQPPSSSTAYDVGFILNPEPDISADLVSQLPSTTAVYNKMPAWINHDDLQIHNKYMV